MGTYLERYQAGEYQQVWAELMAYGEQIRTEAFFSDALAVARETMRRAKVNVELLYQRLVALGYVFVWPEGAFLPAQNQIIAKLDEVERSLGPIPLSLRAWYELIGSVDFRGSYPFLASYEPVPAPTTYHPHPLATDLDFYPDPLVMFPFETAFEIDSVPIATKQGVVLAPDSIHKANVSGGESYQIFVPNGAVDALLAFEWHQTTFVNYLRTCFQWGGFPGFDTKGFAEEYREDVEAIMPPQIPHALLRQLTQGLLPI